MEWSARRGGTPFSLVDLHADMGIISLAKSLALLILRLQALAAAPVGLVLLATGNIRVGLLMVLVTVAYVGQYVARGYIQSMRKSRPAQS